MNLGDGLLFELENGKPRLILLSHGSEKNPSKPSCRPRTANILSSRQPSCVDELQGEERPARQLAVRHRESKSKTGGAAASFTANTATTGGKSTTGCNVKVTPKVKSDRQKHSTTVGSLRTNGKPGQPQSSGTQAGGKKGTKDTSVRGDTGLKDGMVCLTSEQLQKILNTVQTSSTGRLPPEESRTHENKTGSKSESSTNEGGEMKEEDRGGGGTETPGCSQDKNNRSSGCLFSWMDQRQSESRAAVDAKKAQWRRELDEQVALKQQKRSAPSRLQAEEDTDSLLSVQTSISLREQPAAIRSSLRLGEVTPVEEMLGLERREDQRRRWLQELDRQKEETAELRKREKLLQSQTEDHELWATHFDSLQKKPPVLESAAPSAPPPALSNGSERGEWEPSSSLSLVWEAMSSCGAESVGGASVDTTSGYPTRASHLRTMTALLDPVQIEERERRRLKQLQQQRDIEAQLEERRQLKTQEEARRREEEEQEERRLALERNRLERRYELDAQRQKSSHHEVKPKKNCEEERHEETEEHRVTRRGVSSEEEEEEEVDSPVSPFRDTAVQTDEAPSLAHTADTHGSSHPPSLAAAPPNGRSRAGRAGKENICVQAAGRGGGGGGGGDPYEVFARTERSKRDKRRPEWNTQRPSRRFVPASERYPAPLQRHRQESRLKRQAELRALQEKACLSRTNPPLSQDPRFLPNPSQTETSPDRKGESFTRGPSSSAAVDSDGGRSPPVPAVRHRVQAQQAPPSSPPPPPLYPPVLEYIPYVRTHEVFNLDPLEPADTAPPHTHTEAPPQTSTSPPAPPQRDALLRPELGRTTQTHRQQEILRGLAQLRQGLLQKQRELEIDLNPLLKRHDNDLRTSSASHRM